MLLVFWLGILEVLIFQVFLLLLCSVKSFAYHSTHYKNIIFNFIIFAYLCYEIIVANPKKNSYICTFKPIHTNRNYHYYIESRKLEKWYLMVRPIVSQDIHRNNKSFWSKLITIIIILFEISSYTNHVLFKFQTWLCFSTKFAATIN